MGMYVGYRMMNGRHDLVYSGGYASFCDSSCSGYWDADGRGWCVDGGAETVS